MPSRAELRVRGEWVLRAIVIAALAAMLWQTLRAETGSPARLISKRGLDASALSEWSKMPGASAAIQLRLDGAPSGLERAWLRALAAAGSTISWSGDLAPLMLDVRPRAAPAGGTTVLVGAPRGSSVAVGDEIGAVDTLTTKGTGASIALRAGPSRIYARSRGTTASTSPADSVLLRKVMVIGSAGWESKFVVAALEEEGWKVDAFIRVAPGVDVTQGSLAAIDTARYSAVVALDSAASPYAARIAQFVRTGGGLLLAPGAALLDGTSSLRAGNVGNLLTPPTREGESVDPSTLPLRPITALRPDAIPLESRRGSVSIAARRVGAGRVLQAGYDETWRWRMDGGDDGVRAHREWWTDLLSKVVYAPTATRESAAPIALGGDEAPLADLIASIGPAASGRSGSVLAATPKWAAALFMLLALALLTEVTSRRSRGAS